MITGDKSRNTKLKNIQHFRAASPSLPCLGRTLSPPPLSQPSPKKIYKNKYLKIYHLISAAPAATVTLLV